MIPARTDKISGITGVILAGGKNTRFPALKGFIRVKGIPIMQRSLGIMNEFFPEVLISTNTPEAYFRFGISLLGDVLPSRGPMAGIYTSLINSCNPSVFVIACDMPFVSEEMMRLVCMKYARVCAGDYDATVPVFDGEPQPLFGVYCNSVLPALEKGIVNDKVAMKQFLREIRTFYIDESEVRAADPRGLSFVNINTMEDYEMVTGHKWKPDLQTIVANKQEAAYRR
jgi:molybdopterin-guanine dinucleotide biosynthesis protein A